MARCIFLLAICFAFAVPLVQSRRIHHDNTLASTDVAQEIQEVVEHGPPMYTIFVFGFEENTNEEALKKHFGAVGAIAGVRFQSRRGAVITYETPSAATRAVNELHETTLEGQGRYVEVKLDDPYRERAPGKVSSKDTSKDSGKGASRSYGRSIFVSGFEDGTDSEALTNHFGTVGAIDDHHFQSKLSAVLTYVEASAAQKALATLDGSTISGQRRFVKVKLDEHQQKGNEWSLFSNPVARTASSRAVYASGFDFGTDEAALEKHFGTVGAIESCAFQSKGSAVVTFANAASAQQAVTELDGTTMTGQNRYVAVKLDSKGSNAAGGNGK